MGIYERPWKIKMNTHSSFHHRWLLGGSSLIFPFPMLIMSIISLSALHLGCFSGEFVPGPEMRLSRRPLDPSSDPTERQDRYLFFSSPLEPVKSQPPFRDYWEWPCRDISPLPQHLGADLIRSQGFVYIYFSSVKCSLTWSPSTESTPSLLQI